MQPALALTYSSQAPIYGGIASGWSLPIPMILEDTSQGRLRTHSGEVEADEWVQEGAEGPPKDDRFISTMAGSRPLVRVDEPSSGGWTYRAQHDASYTRYEKFLTGSFSWRAFTTDGHILTFGDKSPGRANCPNVGPGFAPLTSQVDSFGNEVAYSWQWEPTLGECRIAEITWGMNASAGITLPFARVYFEYGGETQYQGFYVGSRVDYRTGRKMVSGASRLVTITVTAFAPVEGSPVEHTRLITLGYDGGATASNAQHAPFRKLTSLQESAWRGVNEHRVDLPEVTFEYESPVVTLNPMGTESPVPWTDPGHTDPSGGYPKNLGWGYRHNDDRWPTVEAMMIDLDGDGLLDRLTNTSEIGSFTSCTASWQRNQGLNGSGALTFGTPPGGGAITLPRLKWGSGNPNQAGAAARRGLSDPPSTWEGCSLNGQMTTYFNSAPSTFCHDGNSCYSSTTPGKTGQLFCGSAGTKCPPEAKVGTGDYRTYLAYRWLDVDADGLTDLVAAIHGSIDRYDVDLGSLPGPPGTLEPKPFGISAWPSCPGTQVDQCRDLGTLLDNARTCDGSGPCTVNWGTVNTVLNSTPAYGCFRIMARQGDGGGGGGSPKTQAPYTRCEGLYPWFIFRNGGNGTFPTIPEVKYQPVPLESDGGDSALYSSGLQSQNHGVFDFDGDGVLDGVVHGKELPEAPNPDGWYVWLGDGTGALGPKRYYVPTRKAQSSISNIQTLDAQNRISAAVGTQGSPLSLHLGTVDLNGDGLPDHYLLGNDNAPQLPYANIAMNVGTMFELLGPAGLGAVNTPSGVLPTTETATFNMVWPGGIVQSGESHLTNRLQDVDNDGRADVVNWVGAAAHVYFNLGGQFQGIGNTFPGDSLSARRHVKAVDGLGGPVETMKWELTSDVLDLDGSGVPEGVRASTGSSTGFLRNLPDVAPPRLLKKIANGRGLETFITYASMHEDAPSANQTVTQTPNEYWWDGRPKATPATMWVTKSIRVEDKFDAFADGTGTTTSYQYKNPRHGKDDQGQYGFRGFETVTTTSQSGARTVETFAYDIDWSGRLQKSAVFSAETPATPVTVDVTTYARFDDLFPGKLATILPTRAEHFVCADGQTEAACATPSGAVHYTRSDTDYLAKTSDTAPDVPLLHVASEVRVQHQAAQADKDRVSTTGYWLAADGSTYRLRPILRESKLQTGGVLVTFAKSETTWDASNPAYARKASDTVWFDASTPSTTNYSYEETTGNLLSVTTPRGHTTSYEYDARKLFVAFDNTPLYTHDIEYDYEYGTGVKLETRGPNWAPCTRANPPNCNGPTIRQTTKVTVDGLGRPLEVWATVNPDASNYELRNVGLTTYVDTATSTVPTSVTTWSALKQNDITGEISYAVGRTDYDGHGRPTKVTQYKNGSAGPAADDNVTAYAYRLDGTLQTVSLQSPTATTPSLVSYTYTFDSLGRPTGVTRPDSGASGASVSYKAAAGTGLPVGTGVYTDSVEVAGGSAKRAQVRRTLDADGRLIKVEEKTAESGGQASAWATTLYEYDAAGNVSKITDAENKVTELAHD